MPRTSAVDRALLGGRVALMAALRTFQAMIVGPATIGGTAWLCLALASSQPMRDTVIVWYRWADEAFRTAPAGQMRVVACNERGTLSATLRRRSKLPPAALPCHPVQKLIATDAAIDASVIALEQTYQLLVVLSIGYLLVVPARSQGYARFFGWPAPDSGVPAMRPAQPLETQR